jgi:hypothetical protein
MDGEIEMAHGEITVTGDDVFEALTICSARSGYERVLSDEGEKLADLVSDRIIAKLATKLQAKEQE